MTIDASGTAVAGTDYDLINVTGSVVLAGNATVIAFGGYTPVSNDLLTVVVGTAAPSGTWSITDWNTQFNGNAVELVSTASGPPANDWTGGAADGQWNTAANWSGGVPAPTDSVVIGLAQNVTLNTAATVAYLTMKFHLQIRIFPLWQLTMTVFALLAVNAFIQFWIDGVAGIPSAGVARWTQVLSGAVLWPPMMAIMDRVRMQSERRKTSFG